MRRAPTRMGRWKQEGGMPLTEFGFRTEPYSKAKNPNTFRIVVLGDSFTFSSGGVPHSSMWHVLAGRALEAELHQRVEVINLGVPSVGPRFEKRLYELEGQGLQPDLVLLGFFVGNDLADRIPPWWIRRSFAVRFVRSFPALLSRWNDIRQELARLRHPAENPGAPLVYDPQQPTFDTGTFLAIERARADLFRVDRREVHMPAVSEAVEMLSALEGNVRSGGATLMVVLIPDELQVSDSLAEASAAPGATYEYDWVQWEMGESLKERGIAVVDLLPASRSAGLPLYRPRDTHWNLEGNALAAREITRYLREQPALLGW